MGPAAMNGPTPGIANMPMPANHPNAPPMTAPAPPPATAPSADFVPFSWPNSFEPRFWGISTDTSVFRNPLARSLSTAASAASCVG